MWGGPRWVSQTLICNILLSLSVCLDLRQTCHIPTDSWNCPHKNFIFVLSAERWVISTIHHHVADTKHKYVSLSALSWGNVFRRKVYICWRELPRTVERQVVAPLRVVWHCCLAGAGAGAGWCWLSSPWPLPACLDTHTLLDLKLNPAQK